MDRYLLQPVATMRKVTTEDIGEAEIEQVVTMTEGFSGRAIAKLAIAWQAAAYGTEGAVLDRATFLETVNQHKQSISVKDEWMKQQQVQLLTSDGTM